MTRRAQALAGMASYLVLAHNGFGLAPVTADATEETAPKQIPVVERENMSRPAKLFGLSGSAVWRRVLWHVPRETPSVENPHPQPQQALRFVSVAPVYWSSAQTNLPLLLILFPPMVPEKIGPGLGKEPPLTASFRVYPARTPENRELTPSSPLGSEDHHDSLPATPGPEHRAACARQELQAVAGWLCLAHGQGSPLTSHSDRSSALVDTLGNSPTEPAVGLPLFEKRLTRPVACEAARLAVCALAEGAPHIDRRPTDDTLKAQLPCCSQSLKGGGSTR